MIIAFVESIKYVGHLYPVAFLRIFLGYYYLNDALLKFTGTFLSRPEIVAIIQKAMPSSQAPDWYKSLLEFHVIPNWHLYAYLIVVIQFVVALSYIFGYMVRPIGILALLLSLNFLLMSGSESETLFKTFIVVHITMAWVGAGRCLGIDYFFYKRKRGIWW